MTYVVIDLEFNQPYDFAKNAKGLANANIPFEIIQIGAVKLNNDFEMIGSLNLMIKPVIYKRLHPFVRKITGFSSSNFTDAIGFVEAFESFVKFCDDPDCVICVWGDNDIKLLYKNILYYKLDYKLLTNKYINLQEITGAYLKEPNGKLIGLKNAINMLELPIDSPFHDAYNDAYYTSCILRKLKNCNLNILTHKLSINKRKSVNIKDYKTDLALMYTTIEKEYGRKISKKEKDIFKRVYDAGLAKEYEVL